MMNRSHAAACPSTLGECASLHVYTDAVLGAQRDGGDRFDGMTRHEIEMKPLLDHGKEQHGLQHGEGCADAYPRTAAKREIGEAGNFPRPDGIFAPALWVKCVRIGEEPRVTLRQ